MVPSESDEAAPVTVMDTPAVPEYGPPALAVGGTLAGEMLAVAVSESVAPSLSVTVRVMVLVPLVV